MNVPLVGKSGDDDLAAAGAAGFKSRVRALLSSAQTYEDALCVNKPLGYKNGLKNYLDSSYNTPKQSQVLHVKSSNPIKTYKNNP